MGEVASAQQDEIRKILLNRHLDFFSANVGPKRPGSAPPQAEVLPGSPMGACQPNYNIITGEPLRQHPVVPVPLAAPKPLDSDSLGLSADAEEALRSRPDYVAYYYANVRNNPRLPPPIQARDRAWGDSKSEVFGVADAQGKAGSADIQAQATFNLLFGGQLNFKDGSEPVPIQSSYLGQDMRSNLGSSLNGASNLSPPQHPDTLTAAWANIASAAAAASPVQRLDSLLSAFGSPKTSVSLNPLLTAELKVQTSGLSLYSTRSADEHTLHEAIYSGSTPHTPAGGSPPGGSAPFGPFSSDLPRQPSLHDVGRSTSNRDLGAALLGKDPKTAGPASGNSARLLSVIGDHRTASRTPSKLRIGTTVSDPDPQQQLLDSLTDADATAAAAAAAAVAAAGPGAAAAAAAAQVQAAVEAFQSLPPAAASAFAAALGGADQAALGGQLPVATEVLLGGAAGVHAQHQMQAMYMAAAAMYPTYPQQAMQAAMAGYPGMAGAMPSFPMGGMPGAFSPGGLPVAGLSPNAAAAAAASMFGTGGGAAMTNMAAMGAGLRSQHPQQFSPMAGTGGGFVPPFAPGAAGMTPEYASYYQKMLEAQALAAAGGGKDVDMAALLRAGMLHPPPSAGPPPPPPAKDRRNGGEPGAYGHGFGGAEGGMGSDRRAARSTSFGRDHDRNRSSNPGSPVLGAAATGSSMFGSPGMVGGAHNSRLRTTSGPGPFVLEAHQPGAGVHQQGHAGPGYAREGRDNREGAGTPRRHGQRRDNSGMGPSAGGADSPNPEGGNGGGHHGSSGGGSGRNPRSSGDTLLDDFKQNKTGRKYELREILGHVYEFSLDQHGSRFIQQKLEGVAPEDLDAAFSEVLPRVLHLMTDVFGNYVVQKFFEHGTPEQRTRLAKALHGHVLQLSLQMYGCRVVQKAIEVLTEEQQIELVAELDGHIMRCVRDQNGNHVIQKCIECVPTPRIIALLDNFLMCVVPLSTHPFGCRIIQRILEHVKDPRRRGAVMADILASAVQLTQDQYGNYVIQHVLERGTAEERSSVSTSLAPTVVALSMHKFASNVIEKCLTYGNTADRDLLINRMLKAQQMQMQQQGATGVMDADMEIEQDPVAAMMKDQFGNYVVQKVLEVCSDEQREIMLARVRQQLHALRRFTYGKHIVSRVEKLLSAGTRYQTHAKGRLLPDDEALAAAAAAAANRLGGLALSMPPPPPTKGGGDDAISNGSSGGGEDPCGQPSAPMTPPVSTGASENEYTSTAGGGPAQPSDGGAAAAPECLSSGELTPDEEVAGEP